MLNTIYQTHANEPDGRKRSVGHGYENEDDNEIFIFQIISEKYEPSHIIAPETDTIIVYGRNISKYVKLFHRSTNETS